MVELLFAFILWALVHSLTAGTRAKEIFRSTFGERAYQGIYRLGYNVFSGLTLLPIFYLLATRIPNQVIWSVPMPFRLFNYTLQLIAVLGLLVALLQTDPWQFLGLRQLSRFLRGDIRPDPPVSIVTTGVYGLVRHPLYLFSLLFLWADPTMSLSKLVLNSWVTFYFFIGSIYEERRLIREFGAAYLQYRTQVPRILPIRVPSRQSPAAGK